MQLSRKLLALALLAVILFAALPTRSAAQEDEVDVSDVDDGVKSEYDEDLDVDIESVVDADQQQMYVMPAPDVSQWVQFLGVSDNKFVAGEEVVALVGMHNAGDKTYNVSYVGAHLHSPYDQSFYVQNFTVRWTSALLPPRSEVTIEYRFRPDERLDALDYHLSGWMIYNDSAPTPIIYRSLFVNQTIEVVERRAEWTAQSAMAYTIGAVGIAVVAYVFLQNQGGASKVLSSLQGGKKSKSSRRSAAAEPTAASSPDAAASPSSAGWEVKAYKPAAVSKAVGKKREQKPVSKK